MMNDKRLWGAAVIGLIMTSAFVYYIFEVARVFRSIGDHSEKISFDTGFGGLALMGLAPLIAIGEISYRKGWISSEMFRRWGAKVLLATFIALLVAGELVTYWLESRLERAGYVGCISPNEYSRISRGHSMVFVKTSCEALKP